jgi:release factor glutamine methyltransferase
VADSERLAESGQRTTSDGRRVSAVVDALSLQLAALEEPKREARDLLSALLDVPRHWPLLRHDDDIDGDMWKRACVAAARRATGAPLAYAVGRANFRDLTLDVDERVLIPRPETELLVDLVLERCGAGGIVADIGTGSGALAIAMAREGKFEHVIGVDISCDALDVARTNASYYAAMTRSTMSFQQGDLLASLTPPRPLAAVVSNPPYISYNEISDLPPSVRDWEPAVALFSPDDGMAITARLVRQAADALAPGGLLALETDARRASLVAELLATDDRYDNVAVHLDLTGRERFVLAHRRENQ